MNVKELMTSNPACCTRDTPLADVAQMMVDNDCGAIPVVDSSQQVVGMVTDRDIVTRAVAEGRNPATLTASDCMTQHVVSAKLSDSLQECCQKMEENQVRRIPVEDEAGKCCGIVAQADIALEADDSDTGEVVKLVSQPAGAGF